MRFIPAAAALLVALCLLSAAPFAHAKDAKEGKEAAEAVKTLLDQIKAAQKDPEGGGLTSAVAGAAAVHNGTENSGLRKKIQAALGKVLKDKKAGGARVAAATALGSLDDPKGAWKQLSKALPNPKSKETGPAELEALKATAGLAPEAAVPTLLKLMTKGKSFDAAREAITALGRYGKSKKREAILTEMLDTMGRHHAAAEAVKQNPKGGTGDRAWKELGEAYVAALQELTGRSHPDAAAWLEAYRANKKNLGTLFAAPLP